VAHYNPSDSDIAVAELAEVARLLVEAWNCGDAQAFASLFTPVAEYVTGAGERLRGRQAISQLLTEAGPAVRVCLVGEPIAEYAAGHGRLSFAWSGVGASDVARHGTIACTCVRHETAWLIEALHNDEAGSVGETRGSPTAR
jgi:uncharacterized protein (TIGR02246 family)